MGSMNEISVLTSEGQRKVDQRAYATGLTAGVLMESAGASAAELILKSFGIKRAVVVAGKGGNGGDALVVARLLLEHGVKVRAFATCALTELSPTTAVMADRLKEIAPEKLQFILADLSPLGEALGWGDCVIDGLFGSGLDRPLSGRYAQVVRMINSGGVVEKLTTPSKTHLRTICLDLPSGLPSDRGALLGETVQADTTIAMEFLKPAHLLYPARAYCGKVEVAKVAYPRDVLSEVSPLARVLTLAGAKNLLPERQPDGHKGTFGRVLVIAGSTGMSGAAILCARGALRAGAGLVTLACPRTLNPILETALPEVVTFLLPDEEGHLTGSALETIGPALEHADVLAVGPGVSRHPAVGEVVLKLLQQATVPIVLDADGLFPLNSHLDLLRRLSGRAVLTPHPGELARLIDRPARKIDEDRIEAARAFAGEHGVVLMLKGRPTAIGTSEGEVYLNPTGNTGLATGGSGDVLTGLIAGLIAGGASPEDAAILGAYLHGYVADYLARDRAERSILPSDLLDALPLALAEVEG